MQKNTQAASWAVFARKCTGGSRRATTLILSACTVLRQHEDESVRIRVFSSDAGFKELRSELDRLGTEIGINPADTRACVRWVLVACFCVVSEAERRP